MTGGQDGDARRAQLSDALGAVRARIGAACAAAGRNADSVQLIAVTKTYPAEDVVHLLHLGVTDVGESRDQEAAGKAEAVVRLLAAAAEPRTPPRWHFVGQLQSRKCRSVAGYAAAVHSVDRVKLVAKLADAVAERGGNSLDVFVQVNLDPAADRVSRGGASTDAVPELADAVAARSELTLRGVMAVAPLGGDADHAFAELATISATVCERHPHAVAISAGMSEDLEAAIKNGSTHVRVGSALLGRRAHVFR